ncbi:MAG TPA: hypothetical protein DDW52_06630 [Planctomycetaceae bacterium]|nr:hypothetical protein [Planctomycetaceae bacterium]
MDSFIRDYLRDGLIDVGGNDERIALLEQAATDLAEVFTSDRRKTVAFIRSTLVAAVDEGSHVLAELNGTIEQGWQTFASISPDKRVALLVMVGWRAVFVFAEDNPDHQALVWYNSVNAINRGVLDPCVQPVVSRVEAFGQAIEEHACRMWSSKIEKPTKQIRTITAPEVKDGLERPLLLATTSVTNAEGKAEPGSNPNAIDASNAWATHFAKSASNAISGAIKNQQQGLVAAIQEAFNDLRDKFKVIRDEAVRSHQSQNRRTELLWLAESQYSPRFNRAYAELGGKFVVAALAVDIAEISDGISPQSVEHFLSNQVKSLLNLKDVKVEAFVKELAKSDLLDKLSTALITPPTDVPLLGILEAAGELRRSKIKATELGDRLGYGKNKSLSLADLARTLFREIKGCEFAGDNLWQ